MIYPFMNTLKMRMEESKMTGFLPEIGPGYATPADTRMLIVCQDPHNKAVRDSRQLSRTNDDRSADKLWEILDELEIPQKETFPWNAVPWTHNKGAKDLALVRKWGVIPDLLEPMEKLKVVVLLGSTCAWELTDDVREAYAAAHSRDVEILWGPHPSGRGMMNRSETAKKPTLYGLDHEHNVLWLTIVLQKAREYALAASPVPPGT